MNKKIMILRLKECQCILKEIYNKNLGAPGCVLEANYFIKFAQYTLEDEYTKTIAIEAEHLLSVAKRFDEFGVYGFKFFVSDLIDAIQGRIAFEADLI